MQGAPASKNLARDSIHQVSRKMELGGFLGSEQELSKIMRLRRTIFTKQAKKRRSGEAAGYFDLVTFYDRCRIRNEPEVSHPVACREEYRPTRHPGVPLGTGGDAELAAGNRNGRVLELPRSRATFRTVQCRQARFGLVDAS